jgi:ATP-dependent Clp protease adaptor protein ClpS
MPGKKKSNDQQEATAPPPGAAAGGGEGAKAATATKTKPRKSPKDQVEQLPPYNVVLLNDDDHSYEYVIEMLQSVCGHPPEKGFQIAQHVDEHGRAIVLTTHKEKAELKRDQIHSYGTDPRVATCRGSMTAIIQPAEQA